MPSRELIVDDPLIACSKQPVQLVRDVLTEVLIGVDERIQPFSRHPASVGTGQVDVGSPTGRRSPGDGESSLDEDELDEGQEGKEDLEEDHGPRRTARGVPTSPITASSPSPAEERGLKAKDHARARNSGRVLMTLPTDVLLRTTDYLGPMVDDMLTQCFAWLTSLPDDPTSMPFMFEAALDTHDEFNVAPFIAAHGWYRQANGCASECTRGHDACSPSYAVKSDAVGYTSWRGGREEPKFGNSVDIIGAAVSVVPIEATLGGSGAVRQQSPTE